MVLFQSGAQKDEAKSIKYGGLSEQDYLAAKSCCDEIDQEEKRERKRKRAYKPRASRQPKLANPNEIPAIEYLSLAEIPSTEKAVEIVSRLRNIYDDKPFVVGTLRCLCSPAQQTMFLDFLNQHQDASTQDIAQFVYRTSCEYNE